MIRLVVFDWNATILADVKATYEAELEVYKFLGQPKPKFSQLRNTFTIPIRDSYIAMGVPAEKFDAHKAKVNEVFYKYYEERSKNVRTRSGVRKVLEWLEKKDIKRVIVSNHYVSDIEKHLKRLKLDSHFSDILAHHTSVTAATEKNKETRLKHYMHTYNFKPNETFLVGDSLEEIEMGKNLGIPTASISNGCVSTWRLKEAHHDYLINNMGKLKEIIETLDAKV